MFNIIGRSKIWLTVSALMIVAGLASWFSWGLNLNIDFTGGSLLEVSFSNGRPSVADMSQVIAADLPEASVQPAGDSGYILRSKTLTEEEHQKVLTLLKDKFVDQGLREDRFESIGPIIGQELKTKSIWSIIIVLLAIIAYIAFAFRKVSRPVASWKYGVAAIIALIHDLLTAVGIYAFVSHFTGWTVDSLFITALLTILGFSVHDTIVTFDRIREILRNKNDLAFDQVVNQGINATIVRSINTSFTTFLVLLAIFLFGGETIRHFVFTLMIGIVVGTYSSIFIASPILVIWNRLSNRG